MDIYSIGTKDQFGLILFHLNKAKMQKKSEKSDRKDCGLLIRSSGYSTVELVRVYQKTDMCLIICQKPTGSLLMNIFSTSIYRNTKIRVRESSRDAVEDSHSMKVPLVIAIARRSITGIPIDRIVFA